VLRGSGFVVRQVPVAAYLLPAAYFGYLCISVPLSSGLPFGISLLAARRSERSVRVARMAAPTPAAMPLAARGRGAASLAGSCANNASVAAQRRADVGGCLGGAARREERSGKKKRKKTADTENPFMQTGFDVLWRLSSLFTTACC